MENSSQINIMSEAAGDINNNDDKTNGNPNKKRRSINSKAPKPGKKRAEKNQPWPHIEGLGNAISLKSKIVVSMRPRDLDNPRLMINHAQDIFLQTFSISREDLTNLPFDTITGPATPRDSMYNIKNAILTETAVNQYINLYRSNGVILSCHVSVASISARVSPSKNSNVTNDTNKIKWAVLTVTSASSVGNSKHHGIGILGMDRVIPEALSQIGMKGSKAKAKREASAIELNKVLEAIGQTSSSSSSGGDNFNNFSHHSSSSSNAIINNININ